MIILFFGLFFLIRRCLRGPKVFFDIDYENITEYLYILLFRGHLKFKGTLIIRDRIKRRYLFFSKYKEKGDIGIYLNVPIYRDLKDLKKYILELITKYKLDFHYEELSNSQISKVVSIDFKQNLSFANTFFQLFIDIIFDDDRDFYITFVEVSDEPNAFIGFSEEDVPDFEKMGIDITKPVTNGGYLYYKLGPFWGNILKIFGY